MRDPRSRAGGLVLALVAGGTLLAGCQTSGPDSSADGSASAPASASTSPPARGERLGSAGGEPAVAGDVSLPIERYRLDGEQQSRLREARAALVADCMRADGVPPLRVGDGGPRPESDERRYGVVDPGTADRKGYHPGAPGESRSGPGSGPGSGSGAGRPERPPTDRQLEAFTECSRDAAARLGGPLRAYEVVSRIDVRSVLHARRDPEVRSVFRDWSGCMREHGFDYADPWDPPNDPRFTGAEVSDTEKAVARADVACKQDTDLVEIWHHADAARQRTQISEHRAALERAERASERQLALAERILRR